MVPAIIAHRGASFLASHENTIDAFKLAIDIGADYVEFDIRKTLDDELVIIHDDNLNGQKINELTYQELCTLTDRENYRIPKLNEVLLLCQGKIKLDIELKETGYEAQVVSMVTSLYDYDDFMMKSFLDQSVAKIKKLDSKITAGLLVGMSSGDFKRRFNEYFPERRLKLCSADFISPYYGIATLFFIKRMRRIGMRIYPWTVDVPKKMAHFIDMEVDGIITNKPDAGVFIRKGFII